MQVCTKITKHLGASKSVARYYYIILCPTAACKKMYYDILSTHSAHVGMDLIVIFVMNIT